MIDGTFYFFARPETRRRLEDDNLAKVFLIGSFGGPKNFGDILQLHGALRWHKSRARAQVICPLHNLYRTWPPGYLAYLAQAHGNDDWLFCDKTSSSVYAAALGLEPLTAGIRNCSILHIYGGGFFNSRWGQRSLERIESLLDETSPRHYIMSGQQIGQEFAATLVAHCRRYQPDTIGCRDQESVDLMRQQGLDAQFSGDDAFDELAEAAASALPAPNSAEQADVASRPYALYLNSSDYVAPAQADQGAPANTVVSTFVSTIEDSIGQLQQRLGDRAQPLIIEAYRADGPHIQDTLATIKKTRYASTFAACQRVDLIDLLERNCLNQAAALLRQCRLALCTSYHVTLFLKTLGVPVYFVAVNDYYRQKKHGLGETEMSFRDFLAGVDGMANSGETYVAEQSAARCRWFDKLAATLATPPQDARLLLRATSALEHVRKQRNSPVSASPVAASAAAPTTLRRVATWARRQMRKLTRR